MSKPDKYVVVYEINTGYMDCIAICDSAEEAYGHALLSLCDGLDKNDYYITVPDDREGENGMVILCRRKSDDKAERLCTILFYRKYEGDTK